MGSCIAKDARAGTVYALRAHDDEISFRILGSTANLDVVCEVEAPEGQEPIQFRITGMDWFDYISDGRVTLKSGPT